MLLYSINTFKLNAVLWTLILEHWTKNDDGDIDDDDLEQDEFYIGDNPSVVLDQNLGGEELEELILEEEKYFWQPFAIEDLTDGCLLWSSTLKRIKNFKWFKCILKCHLRPLQ